MAASDIGNGGNIFIFDHCNSVGWQAQAQTNLVGHCILLEEAIYGDRGVRLLPSCLQWIY